jgi:release factor glutamine methyltransferase
VDDRDAGNSSATLLSTVVPSVAERLRAAGCVYADDEARLLAEAASGDALDALVERRVAGEPLEHLLGWAAFAGLRVAVAPGVFVPRRRTELLVRETVALAPRVVVDLCCGCGAVAAAVAAALPGAEVHAADVDPAAVACARRNVPGEVHLGDLYAALPDALRGRVDVLVANAPYVPTAEIPLMPPEARDHEPLVALDGGGDGLDPHRRIAAGATEWLAPGGHLLVECAERQVPALAAAFAAAGLAPRAVRDEELDATAVVGRRP